MHLSLAAVLNAAWDLAARRAGVPLWRLLARMSAKQLADVADLRYVSDVLTRSEAESMWPNCSHLDADRIAVLEPDGKRCYTTSPGRLGYSDEKLARCAKRRSQQASPFSHIKLEVGANLDEDRRRCRIAREILGPGRHLMIDATPRDGRTDRLTQPFRSSRTPVGTRRQRRVCGVLRSQRFQGDQG